MQAPAAHDSRAKSQTTRHAWQAMGRAAGRAGSRTIMAVKAAATHDAKDARRSRALSTRRGRKEEGGEKHETGAHADSDCLARSMSGLRLCTLRCGGRAHVLTHHRRRHTRELQRCTRVDLTHMTASVRSWTPWCGPSRFFYSFFSRVGEGKGAVGADLLGLRSSRALRDPKC